MEYRSYMGNIVKAENVQKEIPGYYSKPDLDMVLGKYFQNIEQTIETKLNKIVEDMISNGGTINLGNYYTKDEVKTVIQSMKPQSTTYSLTVATDKQTQFNIPDINAPIATFLIYNTTVRNDYTINGTTLNTLFEVPLGAQLTLVVISLDYTF